MSSGIFKKKVRHRGRGKRERNRGRKESSKDRQCFENGNITEEKFGLKFQSRFLS